MCPELPTLLRSNLVIHDRKTKFHRRGDRWNGSEINSHITFYTVVTRRPLAVSDIGASHTKKKTRFVDQTILFLQIRYHKRIARRDIVGRKAIGSKDFQLIRYGCHWNPVQPNRIAKWKKIPKMKFQIKWPFVEKTASHGFFLFPERGACQCSLPWAKLGITDAFKMAAKEHHFRVSMAIAIGRAEHFIRYSINSRWHFSQTWTQTRFSHVVS